jgi:hypothetical protein
VAALRYEPITAGVRAYLAERQRIVLLVPPPGT